MFVEVLNLYIQIGFSEKRIEPQQKARLKLDGLQYIRQISFIVSSCGGVGYLKYVVKSLPISLLLSFG